MKKLAFAFLIGVTLAGGWIGRLAARQSAAPQQAEPDATAPVTPGIDLSIVPEEGRTTWAPGVRGGIPARTTVCATVAASTFGDGAREASAGIQSAIAKCPAGQTVQLTAGTFLVNNLIQVNKGITVRGAGPGKTTLVKRNGARPWDYHADDQQPIFVVGPMRWPQVDETTSVNLTADAVKGTTSIVVSSAKGLKAGQFVLLDEDDYAAASWRPLPPRVGNTSPSAIWASDRIVFQKHNPPDRVDDSFPESLTWFSRAGRPLSEIKEIVGVKGNTVTFSTPMHATYEIAKQAQVTRYTGESVHLRDAGVEDLTVSGGSHGNIRFEAAAYSWMKNVDDTFWLGDGVGVAGSFRVEIRDSRIHDGAWPQPGGGGYAISLSHGSSEVLIENNIVGHVNKVIVVRSSGAGSVVGYNYMDNGFILSQPGWVEVGLNASHQVGSHHVLFEGNESFNYDSDNTHGNAIAMTVFRNHLIGRRSAFPDKSNSRGAGLMYGSWWHSFIGNVLGEAGPMPGWKYEDPGDGSLGGRDSAWGSDKYVWKLGYDPTHWEQHADPQVKRTTVRDGNFDFVTKQTKWDRAPRPMPASLYLTSKPAFFGDDPWPWVTPTGATKLATLPARKRADTYPPSPPPPKPD